jgi:hypothetical protein
MAGHRHAQGLDGRRLGGHRALAEGGGDQIGLHPQGVQFRRDQGVFVLVQIEQPGQEHQRRQQVDRQDADGQRRAPPPRRPGRRSGGVAVLRAEPEGHADQPSLYR